MRKQVEISVGRKIVALRVPKISYKAIISLSCFSMCQYTSFLQERKHFTTHCNSFDRTVAYYALF